MVMFWEIKKFSLCPDFLLTNWLGCGIMEIWAARGPLNLVGFPTRKYNV